MADVGLDSHAYGPPQRDDEQASAWFSDTIIRIAPAKHRSQRPWKRLQANPERADHDIDRHAEHTGHIEQRG